MSTNNEDNGTFVCTECKSDQVFNPFSDKWVQLNMTPPCKYCGGVVIYVEHSAQRNEALRQHNRRRNLSE